MHLPCCGGYIGSVDSEVIHGHDHACSGGIDEFYLVLLVGIQTALPKQLCVADEPEGTGIVLLLHAVQCLQIFQ